MDQEQTFLQILMDAVRFELQAGSLTIFTSSGDSLVFQKIGG